MIQNDIIKVVTCNDIPLRTTITDSPCDPTGVRLSVPLVVGDDPEPYDLQNVPLGPVLARVTQNLITGDSTEVQPQLWQEYVDPLLTDSSAAGTLGYHLDQRSFLDNGSIYFVSALENGTTTGVLREHAIRMNSSVNCGSSDPANFPSICPGAFPFTTSYEVNRTDLGLQLLVRICAPGNYQESPWSRSRDRQDVKEELYIDLSASPTFDPGLNVSIYCTASTTRAYFELGNYFNGYVHQPLLEHWPDPDTMLTDFNDIMSDSDKNQIPSRMYVSSNVSAGTSNDLM